MRKWFKFYGTEYLSDPKIMSLSPCDRSCWLTLLCLTSVNDNDNDNGLVRYLTEERLMTLAGLDTSMDEWENTRGVLEKFQNLGMIQIDNEMITVNNWKKRQETNLNSYERVKRHREKKKVMTHDNKSDNDRLDKIRLDKIRKEENKERRVAIATTPSDECIDFFNKGKTYSEISSLLIIMIPN